MISVARRRGLDAMSPRVWRMRGMASPITGTAGRSSSRLVGPSAGSTVPRVARTAVAVAVGSTVGVTVGAGVLVGMGTSVGAGVGVGEGVGVGV